MLKMLILKLYNHYKNILLIDINFYHITYFYKNSLYL